MHTSWHVISNDRFTSPGLRLIRSRVFWTILSSSFSGSSNASEVKWLNNSSSALGTIRLSDENSVSQSQCSWSKILVRCFEDRSRKFLQEGFITLFAFLSTNHPLITIYLLFISTGMFCVTQIFTRLTGIGARQTSFSRAPSRIGSGLQKMHCDTVIRSHDQCVLAKHDSEW